MAGVAELMKSLGISKEPEMAPPGTQAPIKQLWDNMLNQFMELSTATVEQNLELARRVNQLEEELQVWKQARTVTIGSAEREKQQYEEEKSVLQKRINILESMQDSMVLCVLDGDGNIFADHLLAAGLEGGREAARNLTSGIAEYLRSSGYGVHQNCTFWLSIYFNKKGLQDTLLKSNVCSAEHFEAFLVGVSQASTRFLLVDVGYGKEAADAKIKEYLQTYTRFPQTLKVFFGGGHDNGYLPTLTALENERLLNKIVLLKGYRDVAAELKALKLETLTLNNLFRGAKLVTSPSSRLAATPAPSEPGTPVVPPGLSLTLNMSPPSNSPAFHNNNEQVTRKQINPNLPLNKQEPGICNEYYLLNRCSKGEACPYYHDYELSPEQVQELRTYMKRIPCKNGTKCKYGSGCRYGHVCPYGSKCSFLAKGTCKFKSADAHGEVVSNGASVHPPSESSPSKDGGSTNSFDALFNLNLN